jgi:hypothetical protein
LVIDRIDEWTSVRDGIFDGIVNGQCISSDNFKSERLPACVWQMRVFPSGYDANSCNKLLFRVCQVGQIDQTIGHINVHVKVIYRIHFEFGRTHD